MNALGPHTSNHLQAQVSLSSLPVALKEVLENSIDASATAVTAKVCPRKLAFIVIDNGTGIDPDHLASIGSPGSTSKISSLSDLASITTLGFRGQALAALASVSHLTIISQTASFRSSFAVKFANGFKLYSRPRRLKIDDFFEDADFGKIDPTAILKRGAGTIVIATGLFGNVPVRKRQLQKVSSLKFWNEVRDVVFDAAVVNPRLDIHVFKVDELGIQKSVYQIRQSDHEKVSASMSEVFRSLYHKEFTFEDASLHENGCNLSGVISRQPSQSSNLQFIYYNGRKVCDASLFKEVQKMFQSTDVFEEPTAGNTITLTGKPFTQFPVYIFKITGPSTISDILQDPSKNLYFSENFTKIKNLVIHAVSLFLDQDSRHLIKQVKKDHGKSFDNGISLNSAHLSFSSNMKVGHIDNVELNGRLCAQDKERTRSLKEGSQYSLPNFGLTPHFSTTTSQDFSLSRQQGNREEPIAKLDLQYLSQNSSEVKNSKTLKISDYFSRFSQIKLSRTSLSTCRAVAQIDKKFILASAKLPVVTKSKINKEGGSYRSTLLIIDQHACDERIQVEKLFKNFVEDVILNANNGNKLLPIELPIRIKISFSEGEINLVLDYIDNFAFWGINISYDITDHAIAVTHLPKLLFDKMGKCEKTNADFIGKVLLQHSFDLFEKRKNLRVHILASRCSLSDINDQINNWWEWMPAIPGVLIDLINSKACRSAIMFGDALSLAQCQELIQKLKDCRFAFQCAHGRPSVIPVGDLDIFDNTELL